jgi:hypothetical protein
MISKILILSSIISVINTIINYYLYQDYYLINNDDSKLVKIFSGTFISSFFIIYIYEYYSHDNISIDKLTNTNKPPF